MKEWPLWSKFLIRPDRTSWAKLGQELTGYWSTTQSMSIEGPVEWLSKLKLRRFKRRRNKILKKDWGEESEGSKMQISDYSENNMKRSLIKTLRLCLRWKRSSSPVLIRLFWMLFKKPFLNNKFTRTTLRSTPLWFKRLVPSLKRTRELVCLIFWLSPRGRWVLSSGNSRKWDMNLEEGGWTV